MSVCLGEVSAYGRLKTAVFVCGWDLDRAFVKERCIATATDH